MATGSNTSTTPSTLLAGKQGAKYAGGNVTLVRSAVAKTPTKIAPAPPQSVVTAVSTSSQQPTSLLIKNASGQVTMATLVQSKQSGAAGVSSLANLSPQKFVLRPSAPVSVSSAQGLSCTRYLIIHERMVFTILMMFQCAKEVERNRLSTFG